MIEEGSFRPSSEEYFRFICSIPIGRRQSSPFIVCYGTTIREIGYLKELFKFPDETKFLQAWPGTFRTDVFKSSVGQLRNWVKNTKSKEFYK